MAREFVAGGGGRSVWQTVKQLVVPRHYGKIAERKMWSGYVSSSFSLPREQLVGHSSARWRDFTAEKVNRGRIPAGKFSDAGGAIVRSQCYQEGLSALLSNRPDVAVILRSAAVMGKRSRQLINSGTVSNFWTSAAFTGVRKLHSSVVGSPSSSSFVKRQMDPSFFGSRLVSLTTAATRRNLSAGTWTERWNKSAEQFKKAINPKPKANVGGASVGLKAGVQGRQILSEVAKPVQKTFSRYREAVGLQIEAFWKRYYLVVVGIVGLGICLILWRLMFGIASTFISMSEGLAKFGFLALAAAMVIVAGVVVRGRFIINPDAVYRVAMRKLNTSAAVLEVMGAPLSGTDLRAYIMSGGGFRLKNFRPRLAGKRCFIIFPIRGSERRGLVSIEVKKKKGQYIFKLLAVDVPTAGGDQRLYLVGDENEYKVGGGLMSELRDPIVKAMAAQKEFEDLDMREEEDDERKAMEAENLRALEAAERSAKEQAQEQDELDKLAQEQAQEQDELDKLAKEQVQEQDELSKSPKIQAQDELEKPAEEGKGEKPLRKALA